MTYKHNQQPEEYTPLWVKLFGGIICLGIGAAVALALVMFTIDYYARNCEPGCKIEQILNNL